MTKAFEYNPISTDSNYAPLLLELRDAYGDLVNVAEATFSVVIKDEQTGATLVQAGEAFVNTDNPYLIEYLLDDDTVALITHETTWLVEWTVTAANGRVYRMPSPCRLPVRPKL